MQFGYGTLALNSHYSEFLRETCLESVDVLDRLWGGICQTFRFSLQVASLQMSRASNCERLVVAVT